MCVAGRAEQLVKIQLKFLYSSIMKARYETISLPLAIVLLAFCPVMYMEQRRLPFVVVRCSPPPNTEGCYMIGLLI